MNDRRRLLVFSVLILAAVALVSVGVTAYDLHLMRSSAALAHGADHGTVMIPALAEHFWRSTCLAVATAAVVVIAGGTLLVRASNPFMRRLEQSEGRMRAIVSTAGDGIITLDERGTVESFNLASERMFGIPACDAIGKSLEELLVIPWPVDRLRSRNLDLDVLKLLSLRHDVLGRCANGERFPVELSASELMLPDQTLFTVIVRDVTERKETEELMRRHMAMLREAHTTLELKAAELVRTNRELDDFTYVASHDLKEPLRGISSYCQILLEDYGDKLDADGQRRLTSLVALCGRLTQLIDDLLAYSRISRQIPKQQEVDMNVVLEGVLETLGPAIDRRSARVDALDRLPTVECDPTMAGEILRNLIGNALKFNESSCPTVEIGCVQTSPPTFWVRDNGIGVPAEYHEAIFTMFRRLHSRSRFEGTGAGLTFVRRIIESHGGRVWLDSTSGCGSTFYFTLAPGEPSEHAEFAASAAD